MKQHITQRRKDAKVSVHAPSQGRILLLLALLAALGSAPARADDAPNLEIHEWSVWLAEPQAMQFNGLTEYRSAMPGLVDTERSRRPDIDKPGPSPLSLMTVYGEPPEVADIDLRIASGRPLAQWPRSEGKANRLRWLDLKLSKELTNRESLAYIPKSHWFHEARELGGLYLQLKKGGRTERFLTYDLELQTTLTARVDGGPEQYKIANLGKNALHDVLLVVPGTDGRRIGWLDKVDPAVGAANTAPGAPGSTPQPPNQPNPPPGARRVAVAGGAVVVAAPRAVDSPVQLPPGVIPAGGQPNAGGQPALKETIADISLSGALASDNEEFQQQTVGEMRRRLAAGGLKENEINLLLSLYAKHFFESDEIQLVFRLSQEAIDELTPLTVEPENAKVKRVALVVARNVDPRLREDVQKLVAELGDSSYAKREKAEKRLKDLGRLAIPSLKEALKNKDTEVVMRAERLLLGQKEQLGPESQQQ
jgi:hypothetical protein